MTQEELISPAYAALCRQLHGERVWGEAGDVHADAIRALAKKVEAATVLDYGCGRGALKHSLGSDFAVREYDPAIKGKDELPEPADLVVCTDVLEHVEPEKLDVVLAHIHGLTLHAAFVVIATRPAGTRLPDGRNAHLIIDTAHWWLGKLMAAHFSVSLRSKGDPMQAVFWLRPQR